MTRGKKSKALTLVALLPTLLLLGVGCVGRNPPAPRPDEARVLTSENMGMPEKVSFQTEDGVTVVGDYYVGPSGGPSALLLHMMPATKESWRDFASALVGRGFSSVLAIDLRGHGESVMRGNERLDFSKFSDAEQQAKMRDVESAVRWLKEQKGVSGDDLALVGASIGANLSIVYAGDHQEVPVVVALSPGLDYRGLKTEDAVAKFVGGQSLYLSASSEDAYSFRTVRRLAEIRPAATLRELSSAGHGTAMFERAEGFMDEVAGWMEERMK